MARGSTRTRRDGRFAIALLIALVAGLLPETAAVVAAATPTPSASWNFDDGSGSTADDGVGNRNGTLVGDATWSALDPHQGTGSVSLPSADGRVVIPSNATLEPATSLAFSVWIRTTATDGILVEKGDAGCSLPAWQLGMYGGAVGFQWRTPTTSGSRGSPQDSRINDGAWHHVALSMVISTGVATLYVDGRTSQNGTGPAPGIDYAASDQTTSDLIIGSLNSCPTLPAGAIADYDDLRFYSTSLAASDVWAMEPSFATTTSLQMTPAVPAPGEITSFFARVTPYPPNAGTITFHYTVDGGADHAIPKDISEVGTALLEFGYPNALPVGQYVFWAEFDGVGPAEASSSNSFDFTIAAYATTTVGHVDGSQPIPIQQSFTLIVSTRYDTDQPGRRPTGTFAFYDVSGAEPV
ncbi:MAG TPA: LamG-like jellyroll fold domain-containing protein, partial [Candidatus Limnocylindrales bacterium]|nr:LamG-like jellyroll fold domain-containing protein [Candidatus Limnocylindrales bacterium]